MRKGKTGGLNDKQYDALLVDVSVFICERLVLLISDATLQFDSIGHADAYVSDSEDEDESLAIPNPAGVSIHPLNWSSCLIESIIRMILSLNMKMNLVVYVPHLAQRYLAIWFLIPDSQNSTKTSKPYHPWFVVFFVDIVFDILGIS